MLFLFSVLPSAQALARREVANRLVSGSKNVAPLDYLSVTNPVESLEDESALAEFMAEMPTDEDFHEVFGAKVTGSSSDSELLYCSIYCPTS